MPGNASTGVTPAAQVQQALELLHRGRLPEADALLRQVLHRQPADFNALNLLGHLALRQSNHAQAAKYLAAAAAVNPANASVRCNLAVTALALGRPVEALECCDQALRIDGGLAEAHSNRGNALCALERPEEALTSYARAIAIAPGLFDAHLGRSNALLRARRLDEALAACDQTLRVSADNPAVWTNRGIALMGLKRIEEALAAFDRALLHSPGYAEAHNNRGCALRLLRKATEAMASFEQALRTRPAFPDAMTNMANVWLDLGRFEQAVASCDEALELRPDLTEALNIRAVALNASKRREESAEGFAKLIAVAPSYDYALGNLLNVRASICNWADRANLISRVLLRVDAGERASSPHALLSIADSPAAQLRCARTFVDDHYPASAPLWRGERFAHERIRVAYLSADFHDHPVAHLIAGVLERHDRRRFETIGVSLRRSNGSGTMRRRLQLAFEHFEDSAELSDREVAVRLRELEVDIAVDLTGHTRRGRLGILAQRPAPVQVSYLGFTGTSGASYLDYLVTDSAAIRGADEVFFSERLVRLPHAFLPNDDAQPIAEVTPSRRDLGLPAGGFVFCAFNNTYKLNPAMFDVWMQLMRETPGSVLWLRDGEPAMRGNLAREAAARGVSAERLVFAPRVSAMEDHLARYRRADLFLDTLPYGAHATARDALWAGLPVLTCVGNAFAGRVAGSLLTALGLPELVTSSLEEYKTRALEYANSPALHAEIRAKIAEHKSTHPAFDTDLYRRHLETAYLLMSERRQRGAEPEGFSVPAIG
jgi:predicted O-linked N-acetylglucosamine transferase (SPINDLY family)